jgi:hypothetical protein
MSVWPHRERLTNAPQLGQYNGMYRQKRMGDGGPFYLATLLEPLRIHRRPPRDDSIIESD